MKELKLKSHHYHTQLSATKFAVCTWERWAARLGNSSNGKSPVCFKVNKYICTKKEWNITLIRYKKFWTVPRRIRDKKIKALQSTWLLAPPSLQFLDANHHVEVTLGILLDHVSHIVGLPRLLWIHTHTQKNIHMVGHKSHCQPLPLLLSPLKKSPTPFGCKEFIVNSLLVFECLCVRMWVHTDKCMVM